LVTFVPISASEERARVRAIGDARQGRQRWTAFTACLRQGRERVERALLLGLLGLARGTILGGAFVGSRSDIHRRKVRNLVLGNGVYILGAHGAARARRSSTARDRQKRVVLVKDRNVGLVRARHREARALGVAAVRAVKVEAGRALGAPR